MPKPDLPQLLPNNNDWWPGRFLLYQTKLPSTATLQNNGIASREGRDTILVVKVTVDRATTQGDRGMVGRDIILGVKTVDKAITQEG